LTSRVVNWLVGVVVTSGSMSYFGGGGGCYGGGCFGKGKGKLGSSFEEEDRSRDWYCGKCKERNFAKRDTCFKCGVQRSAETEAPPPPTTSLPPAGSTLNGMVKSYNKKGFGFIMCIGRPDCQDIYYTREQLSPKLQTRDIPGEHVTFELWRLPNGKLEAHNIRPLGAEPEPQQHFGGGKPAFSGGYCGGKGSFMGKGHFPAFVPGPGLSAFASSREEEDRSRDWVCGVCGERNFVKRFECFRCRTARPAASAASFSEVSSAGAGPKRTFSPHAGSRAVREVMRGGGKAASASSESPPRRSRTRKKKRKRGRSDSSSSKSSRSRKKKSKKHKSRSSSDSSKASEESVAVAQEAVDPEINKAKAEALEKLVKLRDVEPAEARMKEWRALLRQWHPDKNPDRVEVATAVFQFLQKGKAMLEAKS